MTSILNVAQTAIERHYARSDRGTGGSVGRRTYAVIEASTPRPLVRTRDAHKFFGFLEVLTGIGFSYRLNKGQGTCDNGRKASSPGIVFKTL